MRLHGARCQRLGLMLGVCLLFADSATGQGQHQGPITDMLICGDRVLSVSQAGLFEGERDGDAMSLLFKAPFRILAMAMVPSEKGAETRLLIGGGEPGLSGTIGVLDLTSMAFVSRRVATDLVYDLAVNPTKPRAAIACADQRVLLIDLPSLRASPVQPQHYHSAPVRTIRFSPDGAYLASGGLDGLVFLSAFPPRSPPVVLRDHSDGVECLAFSPDARHLASGARDGRVRMHTREGRLLRTYAGLGRDHQGDSGQDSQQVLSMAWGGPIDRLVVGTSGGWLYELSLMDSRWQGLEGVSARGPITCLSFSPGGRLFVGTGRLDGIGTLDE